MLFLDGVFTEDAYGKVRFHRVRAPAIEKLNTLAHTLSQRVARFLERRGLLERDAENSYLMLDQSGEVAMVPLYGHSIRYRIAMGPQQGRKVFALQTLPAKARNPNGLDRVARWQAFSSMPGWRPKPISATSCKGCAGT